MRAISTSTSPSGRCRPVCTFASLTGSASGTRYSAQWIFVTTEGDRVATATGGSVRKKTYRTSLRMSEMLRSYARRIAETRPPDGALGIFWIGQAGFVLRAARTALVVDAFLSDRSDRVAPAPVVAEGPRFPDAFLATHQHRDHLDPPTWPRLAPAAPRPRLRLPPPRPA